jgi:hypothetical protein
MEVVPGTCHGRTTDIANKQIQELISPGGDAGGQDTPVVDQYVVVDLMMHTQLFHIFDYI